MCGKKERLLAGVIFIYLLCFSFRLMEYFILRTDESFWGEAFVHKMIGIVILFIGIRHYGFGAEEIGFTKSRAGQSLLAGIAFGFSVFIPAYFIEIIICIIQGKFLALDFYVSAYSVNGTVGRQAGFLFFAICIAGNIINVVMEEGVFRGLFQKILEKRYSFLLSAVTGSCLFGMWHIVAPARSYYDGTVSGSGFVANAVLLAVTSCLTGFKFAMMTSLTNSLYMAMGDHFVNNAIVNMLHVVSDTGTDELMVVRIAIAQSISFTAILVWYIRARRKK
ncbi:MAG: CPBP family intramembrane metalloprotease [Lachnospiraceae bacterium]|nr:CPBP family intramembrane metalloprotease [Lachnospiraceae bacterium]